MKQKYRKYECTGCSGIIGQCYFKQEWSSFDKEPLIPTRCPISSKCNPRWELISMEEG